MAPLSSFPPKKNHTKFTAHMNTNLYTDLSFSGRPDRSVLITVAPVLVLNTNSCIAPVCALPAAVNGTCRRGGCEYVVVVVVWWWCMCVVWCVYDVCVCVLW